MTFGQNGLIFTAPWGDAPGYGDGWPSAKTVASPNVCKFKKRQQGYFAKGERIWSAKLMLRAG
jgi:hypothetical protein